MQRAMEAIRALGVISATYRHLTPQARDLGDVGAVGSLRVSKH